MKRLHLLLHPHLRPHLRLLLLLHLHPHLRLRLYLRLRLRLHPCQLLLLYLRLRLHLRLRLYLRLRLHLHLRLLQSLAPSAWYVGFDGITYAAPRPAGVVANRYMTMDVSQPAGAYTLATDSPGEWLPGRTFAGPSTSGVISRVQHMIENATLRTQVLSGG